MHVFVHNVNKSIDICTCLYTNTNPYFSEHRGKKPRRLQPCPCRPEAPTELWACPPLAPRLWKACINSVDCNPLMTAPMGVLNALSLMRSHWIVCFFNHSTLRRGEHKPGQLSGDPLLIPTLILKVVKLPLTSMRALGLCERWVCHMFI